ncbi:nuclease [Agrobacterium pusense]|uniref:nuclease n=1 Tax=Agrobacterium pusense TaxID=648995 RepID=UPI00156A9904|nr:nuclease [Agrobacterium pusense]QKJ94627.1 nuclease [Agrobacterium pusense]
MKNDPWRASRHLIFSHVGSLVAPPEKSWVDATAKFVRHYQHDCAEGHDCVPTSPIPLDTSSIATQLGFQSVTPEAALSGSAFLAAGGKIVRLVEVQGGLSIEPLEYADFVATRSIVSLAAMTVTISDVQQFAGNAFPCHELGRSPSHPMVRYAECSFMVGDTARSLSKVPISKGVVFAFGDSAGQPAPVYSQVEDAARATKAGIGASLSFLQPHGERYRANPTRH